MYIFEPKIFPIIKLNFLFFAAFIEVTTSGSDVPIAITERPKKESETLSKFDIFIADNTVSWAPNKVIIIESNIIGIPKIIGFWKVIFDGRVFSISTFSISLVPALAKLKNK